MTPETPEAARICKEDLNEVITSFVQDTRTMERGLFDGDTVPEELTKLRMGKIVQDKYPDLSETDQEAVRQHAIAALNLTQQAKTIAEGGSGGEDAERAVNTALIDGVRRLAMDVRELDIDMIDGINPFGAAYAVLAKTMNEATLKQVATAVAAKRSTIPPDEARELAVRAVGFKRERGRVPAVTSPDAWEKKLAEGAAAFARCKAAGAYD